VCCTTCCAARKICRPNDDTRMSAYSCASVTLTPTSDLFNWKLADRLLPPCVGNVHTNFGFSTPFCFRVLLSLTVYHLAGRVHLWGQMTHCARCHGVTGPQGKKGNLGIIKPPGKTYNCKLLLPRSEFTVPYGTKRQRDGRTDGRTRPVMRPIRPAA